MPYFAPRIGLNGQGHMILISDRELRNESRDSSARVRTHEASYFPPK